jgi:hypothetical protein
MTKEFDKVTKSILKDQERFQKMFANMEKINNTLANRMAPTMQAIEKLNRNMAPAIKAMNKFSQQMAPYANMARKLEANFSPFRTKALEVQKHLNLISASVTTKYLQNPEFLRRATVIAQMVSDLQPETLSELYAHSVEIYAQTEGSDPIQVTLSKLEEKAQSPGTVLSLEFYLNVIISIIFFLMSQNLSEESDRLLFERLDRLETTLIQNYNAAESAEKNASFYIVKKSVNFRTGPSTKYAVLDVLYPNQKVKLISRNSKWIEVEYYNHIDDSYKRGWVYKKYLKLINRNIGKKYTKP